MHKPELTVETAITLAGIVGAAALLRSIFIKPARLFSVVP